MQSLSPVVRKWLPRMAWSVLGLAGAIVLSAPPATASAAGSGSISGRLVNGTAGGSPVGGIQVTLTATGNNTLEGIVDVPTASDGTFLYPDLPLDAGTVYTIGTTFQGIAYTSTGVTLTPDSPEGTVELEVYDTTTSDEAIRGSAMHMVVYTDAGDLEILEMWQVQNTGDMAFSGATGDPAAGTLRFALPDGAVYLTPGPDSQIETAGTEAVSTAAVLPGSTAVSFSYWLPYQGTTMSLARTTDYPVDRVGLLVQDTGIKVNTASLSPANLQMMNGLSFLYFTRENLPKGTLLDASLAGLVKPSGSGARQFVLWPWLLAGTAAVVAVLAVAYPRFNRANVLAEPGDDWDEEELLARIAQLDDDYEDGAINEKDYRAQRKALKVLVLDARARDLDR